MSDRTLLDIVIPLLFIETSLGLIMIAVLLSAYNARLKKLEGQS